MKTVFITGGTGYIGKRLIKQLLNRNVKIIALVRKGSETRLPPGAESFIADPFDSKTFQEKIPKNSVFVQLLGVPHPSPRKAELFRKIDLNSVKQSALAASKANVSHFIYVSVAMEPSSIMGAYQEVRKEGEQFCRNSGLKCTFIRPWYVLGPGHWWPVLLMPLFVIARWIPLLKQKARAFRLVTIDQMIRTLIAAVDAPPAHVKLVGIDDIVRAPRYLP